MRRHDARQAVALAAALLTALLLVLPAPAQQKKPPRGQKPQPLTPGSLPDDQQVDLAITEMLGGWQIGNVEMMRKHYSDDVTVVSGAWEPPLVGWAAYEQAYRVMHDRTQRAQLDRFNTLIRVQGTTAWAVFQWQFNAVVDGKPAAYRGHTTLVLTKQKDRWLIAHNHTSVVAETSQPAAPPAKPGDASPGN